MGPESKTLWVQAQRLRAILTNILGFLNNDSLNALRGPYCVQSTRIDPRAPANRPRAFDAGAEVMTGVRRHDR